MDLAAFSPRKLQLLNQSSPRGSARKRSLFPSNSPQTNDLGFITELCSDDSDVYSPPLVSPSSSNTPSKDRDLLVAHRKDQILRVTNSLHFGDISPKRSPRKMSLGKENVVRSPLSRKSARKPKTVFLEKDNFDEHFITIISDSPEKPDEPVEFINKSSDNFTTPKKSRSSLDASWVRRSPRSASKQEVTIKPNSFYGNQAPILATNQSNRIQGMKCVFRPIHQSRAKAKLVFEDKKRAKKRERSNSLDVMREAKRRKPVFTGVHHAIPKPVKRSPPVIEEKKESVRDKARKITDLSRTPYGIKKDNKNRMSRGWEYTLRFTKPLRYEESSNLGGNRKFFKSSIKDSPISSPGSEVSPAPTKKRKLLDPRKSYLQENSPEKPHISPSDISDLIDDGADKMQDKPEVDDILLRFEEEDEEEKKKAAEREILMNILEDSPIKPTAIENLSNCTASLDLNDSFSSSGCSRVSTDDTIKSPHTPRRMFSIFRRFPANGISGESQQQGSSDKKKWRGVGEDQLQIDVGQKRFGHCQCPECGMLYQVGEAEDEMQHNSFHNSLSTLKHSGWKNENVVGHFGLDYTVVITGDDPKSWQQKAIEVIAFVDKSLGITYDITNVMHNRKVFLYISDKRIVGCMVANPVTKAYKMINSESDVDICSEETYPVRCGVSRMWTLFSHRRQGIASKLLDTVRRNFMYGSILARQDIAFSVPTPDGKLFASKYMESSNFFVYGDY